MKQGLTKTIILITLFLFMASCSNNTTVAKLNLHSARYLNPDINGRPAPLVITIYELKSPYTFEHATYEKLSDNASQWLGTNLFDKQSFEIQPDQQKIIELNLSPATQYLGISAAYRNIDQAVWKRIIKLKKNASKIKININLLSQSIETHLIQ